MKKKRDPQTVASPSSTHPLPFKKPQKQKNPVMKFFLNETDQ